MSTEEALFLMFSVVGGLALFIFGMNVMTDGLRQAAGNRLRSILHKATKNRLTGLSLGTVLGFLVHSSAATVMYVGFANAGLMQLTQSIAPVIGANIGTTLSMQMISFHLADYCFAAIAVGFVVQMVVPRPAAKNAGKALLGFGLLFLGMETMSQAIEPHRELVLPWLSRIDGANWSGLFLGIAVSTLITGIIQSSGATIGMCFVLISAGAFTKIEQVYPIVLGAHIGTCATALLGSIGANWDARRIAVCHLFFNVAGVLLAVVCFPVFVWVVTHTSSDLVHQTANLHTVVMVVAGACVLPFCIPFTRLVILATPSEAAPVEPSHLDESLLESPEKALYATIRELQRVARLCARSLREATAIILEGDSRRIRYVKRREEAINEVKLATKDYLAAMTGKYLSRRQAILIQHLDQCMIDIERIGDHIDSMCDLAVRQSRSPEARFSQEDLAPLVTLCSEAGKVVDLVIESLNPESKDFQPMAKAIIEARELYIERSIEAKSSFMERVADHRLPPLAGMYFSEYVAALDRIVRHSRGIALAESHPHFWIKRKKLDRVAPDAPEVEPPPPPDPEDFLDQLQLEDYH